MHNPCDISSNCSSNFIQKEEKEGHVYLAWLVLKIAKLKTKNIRVGAGGWHEYKKDELLTETRLKAYSREFDFVEVNSTFYELYHPSLLERWRKSVPPEFEFSIICYKVLTHDIGLRPIADAFRVFSRMLDYCKILDSKILVMQIPPNLKLDDNFVTQARDFFGSSGKGNLHIAFEFRVAPGKLPKNLNVMLSDLKMSHIVDLAFEDPMIESELLYSRVFGQPATNNTLDAKDIKLIKNKVENSKSHDVRIVDHSSSMIEDTRKLRKALT